jgi:ribosomal 50S subunit-associated protein YjgA (DUF615 family)
MSKRRRREEESTEERPYVTRTARTQAATAVNKVALQMTEFPPEALDQLGLPQGLREAIDLCQRLKPRGRSRQRRLICQLLRGEDHETIRKRVEALEADKERSKQGKG